MLEASNVVMIQNHEGTHTHLILVFDILLNLDSLPSNLERGLLADVPMNQDVFVNL